MTDDIKKALDTDDDFHRKLLQHCKRLVEVSRTYMNRFYDQWDANDKTIRGERIPDAQDQKAKIRQEPMKMILPFTYAQVQTFIAFMMSLFNQRAMFYEVQKSKRRQNDISPEGDAELCLVRDLARWMFTKVQYQCYLDLCRSSFCVIKHLWDEEEQTGLFTAPAEPEMQSTLFGGVLPVMPSTQTETKFIRQGNRVVSISPYHFFPDIRMPLSRLHESEFCASEDEFSIVRLKQDQKNGMIVNVDKIVPLGQEGMQTRRLNYLNASNADNFKTMMGQALGGGMCVRTEVQLWITPKDFTDTYGKNPLGKEDFPTLFVVWYANDTTILKAEPMNYTHNKFTYDVGEYSADQMRVINESLAEILMQLQDHATWFMNARVTNVRKVIGDKLIVDPAGVEMKDIENRNPVIRLKSGVAKSGVGTWVQQLQLQDVTVKHIDDISKIWEFMQTSSGINENALGQYSQGRRSAAEARTVNAGAASRLKTIATILWETMFSPLGHKLLSNYLNLELEEFQRIVGKDADQTRLDNMKSAINDGLGLEFFDGTAPSEKGYIAQSMQELLLGLLENPESAQLLAQEPFRSLVVEITDLRGIRSPERFLPPQQIMPPVPVQGAGVQPQPQIRALPNANIPTGPQSTGQPTGAGAAAGNPGAIGGTP
jgi:hypothetical protein